ncbi:MAG: hypothetical protein HY243_00760 [Proteobacteria bacterium]|nr:hypothetical protein [Pseudomonadota bacterium]
MTAIDTLKDNLRSLASNRGHRRVFIVICTVWLLATTAWSISLPIPKAPTAPDALGVPQVIACSHEVLDYDECANRENLNLAFDTILGRVALVVLPPIVLPTLLTFVAFVFAWARDGYSSKEN